MDKTDQRTTGELVLGTVQLGLPYGRLRGAGLMRGSRADAILDRAWELGIRTFDTAEGYGEAAARLAAWISRRGHSGASVVTKVKPAGGGVPERAVRALRRFAHVGRRTLLSHGAAGDGEWGELLSVASAEGADAGQSVYTSSEVRAAAQRPGTAVVQAPGNVFDLAALAARGSLPVRLDLRSVFLQGVLLDPPGVAERRAAGTGVLAEIVATAAADAGVAAGALLVAAMLERCRIGDRLVLGADTPEHLDVVPAALALSAGTVRSFAERVARGAPAAGSSVTDPRRWS